MKKNGFTFIEILGVITLLALISTIILISVSKSLKDSKETLSNVQIENIKSAAEMWRTDNIELIPENDYYIISLNDLQNEGYLKENIIDPKTSELINKTTLIEIGMNNINVGDAVDTNALAQRTDNYINQEIQAIKNKLSTSTEDGIYYYNNVGNLEDGASIIYPTREWNRPRGNILIHNHQFISGCIQINGINYDIYKTTVTKLDYPCSTTRGENLIVNGDLSLKDNTNFSSFTYNSEGYFSRTSSSSTSDTMNNFIPVDIYNKSYEMGMTAKTNNAEANYYIGFRLYDIDRESISPAHITYIPNTLTTLAQDLNDGDEYIYITDLTNWNKTTDSGYRRAFIFWNYKDSTGYEYPELTYSRNISDSDAYSNEKIDLENNRIKLNSPWNKGYVKAGTKMSQRSSGVVFIYNMKSLQPISTEWENISKIQSGIVNTGSDSPYTKFWYGTRYIKLSWYNNYNELKNVTTSYKNLYVKEIVE